MPEQQLEGEWRVERLSGLLPPMVGIWKRFSGESGETRFGALLVWRFRIERRAEHIALVYRSPFSKLVDELWAETEDSWLGRTMLGGFKLGRFRMTRSKTRDDSRGSSQTVR